MVRWFDVVVVATVVSGFSLWLLGTQVVMASGKTGALSDRSADMYFVAAAAQFAVGLGILRIDGLVLEYFGNVGAAMRSISISGAAATG